MSYGTKLRVFAFVLAAGFCNMSSGSSHARPAENPVPTVFVSVLAEVKAKTNVPVLLPTELPKPFSGAEHAVVGKADAHEYAVILYYELGVGNAGFAASFLAEDNASYSPRELPNVREVKLANGTVGFFRPVNCGGSCAPANLWFKRGTALYDIQLRFSPSLGEKKQHSVLAKVANSAILAGSR